MSRDTFLSRLSVDAEHIYNTLCRLQDEYRKFHQCDCGDCPSCDTDNIITRLESCKGV